MTESPADTTTDAPSSDKGDGAADEARAKALACEACKDEPCSPEHFAAKGYDPEHFADFVHDLRAERAEEAAVKSQAEADAASAEADEARAKVNADAEAANAAAAEREAAAKATADAEALAKADRDAEAAQERTARKQKKKPRDGFVFVVVTDAAGTVAYGIGNAYEEFKAGQTVEMLEHAAAPLLAIGHVALPE